MNKKKKSINALAHELYDNLEANTWNEKERHHMFRKDMTMLIGLLGKELEETNERLKTIEGYLAEWVK